MNIRTGIIGYGNMGGYHADVITKVQGFELVAVHDIRPERNARAEQNGLRAYGSLEEFLAHPGLELVVVVTPNEVHKTLSIAAMKAGKHVVCEKPVAMDLAELDEIISVSKEQGVLFTVHHNRRWDSDFLTVRKSVTDGSLGEVFDIQSRVGGWSQGDPGWRGIAKHGGGMLYDWGIHLLDQILHLLPEKPVSLYATVSNIRLSEVDDFFKVQFRWRSGLVAEVEMCPRSAFPMPRWLVKGKKGSLLMQGWDNPVVRLEGPDGKPVESEAEMVRGDWSDFYRIGLHGAIRKGEPLWVKPESVRPVMKVIDACRRSSATGEAITLDWDM